MSAERNLRFKYRMMDGLTAGSILTPNIIPSLEGQRYFLYQERAIEIYEWLEFEKFELYNLMNFKTTISFLQDIHRVLTSIFLEEVGNDFCVERALKYICNDEFTAEKYKKIIRERMSKDTEWLISMMEFSISARAIQEERIRHLAFGYIHGDYNVKNIGYRDGKAKIIMDLDRCKRGFHIEDWAMAYFELCYKNTLNVEERVDYFWKVLDDCEMKISRDTLQYVMINRLLRHVYRGLDRGEYQSIFINGLYQIYSHHKEKFSLEAK